MLDATGRNFFRKSLCLNFQSIFRFPWEKHLISALKFRFNVEEEKPQIAPEGEVIIETLK